MLLKAEILALSLTEHRQAEIEINTTSKSLKDVSNNTERQNLFVDSKSWFIKHWMIQKAVYKNLQKPITVNYSIYWQHLVPTLRVQKAEVDQETIYRVNLCKKTVKTATTNVCLVAFLYTHTHTHTHTHKRTRARARACPCTCITS